MLQVVNHKKANNLPESYHSAFDAVRSLSLTVKEAQRTLRPIGNRRSGDVGFGKAAVQYAEDVNRLERKFTNNLWAVARKITEASDKDWQHDKKILSLWHEVVTIVSLFSHHPDKSKRLGAITVDESGKLKGWSANRIPKGIKLTPEMFEKGNRSFYILCAEPSQKARQYGIVVRSPRDLLKARRVKSSSTLKMAQAQVRVMREDIIAYPQKEGVSIDRSIMFCSACNCMKCSPIVDAYGIYTFYYTPNGDKGFNPERRESIAEARRALKRSGKTTYRLLPRVL